MHVSRTRRLVRVAAAALSMLALSAAAQEYPNRPIRLIVPFPPGGTTDTLARVFAPAIQEHLGQPMVVDNRAGAGSQIGMEAGARAAPDGYTLLFGPADGLALLPATKKKVSYDPIKDYTPVGFLARSPLAYVANPKLPVSSLAELIEYAKARPGKLRYASAGFGSIAHLGMELLRVHARLDIMHVPYKGGTPAMQELIAGQTELMSPGPVAVAKRAEAGQLRVLAQTGPVRHPLLATVPTTRELGMPELTVVSWFGIVGPAGLPRPMVSRLNRDMAAALGQPALQKRFIDVGCEAETMSPEAFAQFIAAEHRRWVQVVKAAGIDPID